MQIVSQAKKSAIRGIHKDLEAAIPDIKRIGQKITDTLVGLKQDKVKGEKLQLGVNKVKKRMNKGVNIAEKTLDFLDLSWAFNISDCELVLLENDWTPESGKKPFGCIKVSSFNQEKLSKRFEEMRNDLVTAKVSQKFNHHLQKIEILNRMYILFRLNWHYLRVVLMELRLKNVHKML